MNLIFVYGSLKRNMPNHSILQGKFIGVARTVAAYSMLQVGGFPAMVYSDKQMDDNHRIWGELYEVDDRCLMDLDKFEGTSYERKTINLYEVHLSGLPTTQATFQQFEQKKAQCYMYRQKIENPRDCGAFWSKD